MIIKKKLSRVLCIILSSLLTLSFLATASLADDGTEYAVFFDEPVPDNEIQKTGSDYAELKGPQSVSSLSADPTGKGVVIAIIDSGLDLDNPGLSDANILDGYDYVNDVPLLKSNPETFVDGQQYSSSSYKHGSCIAQIIAGNGLGGSVKGIAPDAYIVPLKAFQYVRNSNYIGGSGHSEWKSTAPSKAELARIIVDAVDVYNADIINISSGFSTDDKALEAAVNYAYSKGVIIVASAGNSGGTKSYYPAAYPNVIGVAATDDDEQRASYSQHNSSVMVTCFGTYAFSFLNDNSEVYVSQSRGTSFSCPAIAATAALFLEAVPGADADDFYSFIRNCSRDLGTQGYDTDYGYGILLPGEGLTWPYCKVVRDEYKGTASLCGYTLQNGGSVFGASYYVNGKMNDIKCYVSEEEYFSYSFSLDAFACKDIKLFYLDMRSSPVKDNVIMSLIS